MDFRQLESAEHVQLGAAVLMAASASSGWAPWPADRGRLAADLRLRRCTAWRRRRAGELGHAGSSAARLNRARAGTIRGTHAMVAAAAACRPRPLARQTWNPGSDGPHAGRRLGRRGPGSGLRARPS
jgi:hypothetical protein